MRVFFFKSWILDKRVPVLACCFLNAGIELCTHRYLCTTVSSLLTSVLWLSPVSILMLALQVLYINTAISNYSVVLTSLSFICWSAGIQKTSHFLTQSTFDCCAIHLRRDKWYPCTVVTAINQESQKIPEINFPLNMKFCIFVTWYFRLIYIFCRECV